MNDNNSKTITLFADSLALPRGTTWGNILYRLTYPYFLEQSLRNTDLYKDFIFINRAERFRTIVKTEKEFEDFALLPMSDFVIVHCGIVDCAPRVLSERQRAWLERLPPFPHKIILKTIHATRQIIIKTFAEKKYVAEADFKKSYSAIIQKAKEANIKLIIINIIKPSDTVEKRSPGFQYNVQKYNEMLDDLAVQYDIDLINANSFVHTNGGHDKLTTDGMHINEQGHAYLYEELLKIITRT